VIPVTKPFAPDLSDYDKLLRGIWRRNWWTNNGPVLRDYQQSLQDYLGVAGLQVLSSGTLALQLAFKALGVKGKVITTPFSYVATTSSLVWEGLEPVFVDVDRKTFNIDPTKIEERVDEHTSAILATHCFGNACDIDRIDAVAQKWGLKVIYDASHCFGTRYKGNSVFAYGDISTLSLHATKPVHCGEGGAVFARDPEVLERIYYMHNFGHDGPEAFRGVGINAKNSELHAALGLTVLKHADAILARRAEAAALYQHLLSGFQLSFQVIQEHCSPNHAYVPVLFESEDVLLRVMQALEQQQIYPRRYFYPSLNKLPYLASSQSSSPMCSSEMVPVANDVSRRIICLPTYYGLEPEQQEKIAGIIIESLEEIGVPCFAVTP
jgi:dTDP-4-amino-4,6-dideoxygalactose transaminase